MRTGAANLVAGGVIALLSGAAGFLLGRSSPAPVETATVQAQSVETDLGPVLEELRALRSEVRAATATRSAVSETGTSTPIPEDRIAQIQESLDRLAKRLEETAHREGRGSGFADLAAMSGRLQMMEGGFEAAGTVREEIRAAHARWSRADLRARYGPPLSEGPLGATWISSYVVGNSRVDFTLADNEVVDVLVFAKQ